MTLYFIFFASQKPVGRLSQFKFQFVKGAPAPCVKSFVITFGQSRDHITCEDKKDADKMIKRQSKDIEVDHQERRRSLQSFY